MSKKIKLNYFILIVSFINLILYQFPFFKFVINNIDTKSFNGVFLIFSLIIAMIFLNALVFYIIMFLLRSIGKWLLILTLNISAICVYFINTYGVIIDKTMIGNVFNTRFEESSSFFSIGLIAYLLFLGIVPSVFVYKIKVIYVSFKKFLVTVFLTLIFLLSLVYVSSASWLWIDKHSKTLGGLVMPWSYIVNTNRFFYHKKQENEQQILLPDAKIENNEKSVVVLVIGESARSQNFSLYGYEKDTNPLLSKIKNVQSFKAESCATYTTAGVKCILEYKNTGKLFEILPNYLFRNDVDVVWRTTNWGEPTVKIKNYQGKKDLKKICEGAGCEYDEVLLAGLKEQILASKKSKILVVLHTSTSHGPTYSKKHPPEFNKFMPVCNSVELSKCSEEELINAYDNTIVYTDYILASLIEELKLLKDYNSSMIYISDHGESLGENNLYMHGIPISIAPKEQVNIPFITWVSDNSRKLKENEMLSQHNIFHSVLDFLSIESPIYDENMSIYEK